MIRSKALEANIAETQIDVQIDDYYSTLQQIMSKYYGIMEGFNTFLKELSHPYINWKYVVEQARGYTQNYFHLFRNHPEGPMGAAQFVEIFLDALTSATDADVRAEAAANLIIYLQKIAKDAGDQLDRFAVMLNESFQKIHQLDEDRFFYFVQSYYPLNRMAASLRQRADAIDIHWAPLVQLQKRSLAATYDYWLSQMDPLSWFAKELGEYGNLEEAQFIFTEITHQRIQAYRDDLHTPPQGSENGQKDALDHLLKLPDFHQFVEIYRKAPKQLLKSQQDDIRGHHCKAIFLFHIMAVPGLASIHEDALREINRTLSWLIGHENYRNIQKLIRKTFAILNERSREFPTTALQCVLNMGKGVYKTDERHLVNFFIDSIIDLGFQTPMIEGVGNDWQIRANSAHVQNIRTWMELIAINPRWSTRLISYLAIHLSLCGVFIKDTDLFPRDVTRLLNSDIQPVYYLVRQLAKLFPVFFNDIGAEGELRDITTALDEMTCRRDLLVHFLRKQSHVESSNRTVGLIEAILYFWFSHDKSVLEPFVPPNLYAQLPVEGVYVDGVHQAMVVLAAEDTVVPSGLLGMSKATLAERMEAAEEIPEADRKRVELAVAIYKLLYQKYNLNHMEIEHFLGQLKTEPFLDLPKLESALAEPDLKQKISLLLDYLERIQAIILSNDAYEIREDIYKKRHITIDIPSMYGSYHELKFDALGLSFRLESLLNVLFEEIIDTIDLSLITKAAFYKLLDLLKLFNRALRLNGIHSAEILRQLDFLSHSLETRGFTFTQYLDIFKGFAQAVKNIINDYFHNIHESNLVRFLSQSSERQLLTKYLPPDNSEIDDPVKLRHRVSEIFFRERLASSLGLPQLDMLLSRILNTLFNQSDKLPKDKLRLLLNYDPKRAIAPIVSVGKLSSSLIYLGNKGYNLAKLRAFGLPVPPGFIITTEVFRCRSVIESYPPAQANFKSQVADQVQRLEKLTGKRMGDPANPLLLSVRSGASISQPGMMDTFLNVGINEAIAEGIARRLKNPWFAWDNFRRFIQCYGMACGMHRDDFDAIIRDHKQAIGIPLKRGFSGDQMKQVALAYKQSVLDTDIEIPDDPYEQLQQTIQSVLSSWHSPKAKTYRRIMGISDDWGTAVTVQAMVFGNLSRKSGTGVFFTHNPRWSEDNLRLWGDFTIGNQGEDVVSGLVQTLPVSLIQQEIEMRDTDTTLETHFPDIYKALEGWARELVDERGWSPQEIEFTFEGDRIEDLYLLQTRDMSMRERKKYAAFDLQQIQEDQLLGHGVGVSGGAMTGRVVFSLEEVDQWRLAEPNTALILVRSDTVPDDIREIYAADGLLTARGGLTSHAAVVAHRLGKTCVAGCAAMACYENDRYFLFNQVRLTSGDFISIDGQRGAVYQGHMPVKKD